MEPKRTVLTIITQACLGSQVAQPTAFNGWYLASVSAIWPRRFHLTRRSLWSSWIARPHASKWSAFQPTRRYSSRTNLLVAQGHAAVPFIPFKSNARPFGLGLWSRMFHCFMFNREEFLKLYNRSSNVETTFSMVKANFGTKVRSKTETA
jgi:hypothetical protein